MNRYHRRSQRRVGIKVVLGARDQALLRSLGRMRAARSGDLLALFFQGVRKDTGMSRLRRLLDGGFLDVRVGGLSEQNVYSLGPLGRDWADDQGLEHALPPQGDPSHHLALVHAWAGLANALHRQESLRLIRFSPDWELRRELAGSLASVIPDARIEIEGRALGTPRRRTSLALEVDLGQERRGELQRKLSAYESDAGWGPSGGRLVVLLVGAGPRRRESVEKLMGALPRPWSLVCTDAEWPGILVNRLSETPLTGAPCGEGRPNPASDVQGVRSRQQGEGPSQ
jgi:hypothetical protein